jgi:hypothetical protein
MSKTPRTDDQAVRIMFGMLDTVVPVEFSRQLETELADKEKQSKEIFPQNTMGIENVQKMAFDLADHACCGLYSEKDIKDFIEKWRKENDC